MGAEKKVVVLVGIAGSGKSTWAKQSVLSSDEIRRLLRDDPTDQTIHRTVFRTMRDLLRRRLELGMPVTYIDATNLTRRERRPYIKISSMYGCEAEAVFFDTPLEICLERNRARQRNVPEQVLRTMAAKLQPPSTDEGFTTVVVISTSAEPPTTTSPEPA
jgi:predicted kinase